LAGRRHLADCAEGDSQDLTMYIRYLAFEQHPCQTCHSRESGNPLVTHPRLRLSTLSVLAILAAIGMWILLSVGLSNNSTELPPHTSSFAPSGTGFLGISSSLISRWREDLDRSL
jgi:hypothetical protein